MRNELNRTEFSESLDRRLSGLQDDPWLAGKVLAKAEGEKPVKKLSATTIFVIALLILTMAGALAAANWGVISRFMAGGWNVNEDAIVNPLKAESDLTMVQVTATEAYWTEDELTVVFKVDATDPNCMPYYEEGEHPEQIEFNGESIDRDKLRGDKNLVSCTIWCAGGDSWDWYEYTDEGLFIIESIMKTDAEKLEEGTVLTYQCYCENLQTGESEDGTIRVELPAMTRQEGHV
ncbi:MAG: hypothetical protein IKZ98_00615 [Clostridia bacterium]|nr:hypothetical protein [Clostridia bacterium]